MQDRSPALVTRRATIDRRIVGTPEQIRRTIALATASGRLVHVSPWEQVPEGVQVTVRLVKPDAAAATPARRRWPVVTAVATGAVAVAGAATYAVVRLVDAVIDALPVILAALVVLALAAILSGPARSRVVCVTMHGPGCRHH